MSANNLPLFPASVRVSVALCTYNGSRHLLEQLESIQQQTHLPDELIVCDDCSTDSSVDVVHAFAAQASFPVRVSVNDANLGSTRNFGQAISLATGDIILLCDQDDVWLPDKIKRFVEMFAAHPEVEGFFSNAWLISASTGPTTDDLWTVLGLKGQDRQFATTDKVSELMVRSNVAFGTVFGIRASARSRVLPIPDPLPGGHLHDGWIATVLASKKSLRGFDEKLSLYRQHAQQQVGVQGREASKLWARLTMASATRREQLTRHRQGLESTRQLLHARLAANEFDNEPLIATIAHLKMRLELPRPRWRRLGPILRAVMRGEYRRHAAPLGSPLRDLFF